MPTLYLADPEDGPPEADPLDACAEYALHIYDRLDILSHRMATHPEDRPEPQAIRRAVHAAMKEIYALRGVLRAIRAEADRRDDFQRRAA